LRDSLRGTPLTCVDAFDIKGIFKRETIFEHRGVNGLIDVVFFTAWGK